MLREYIQKAIPDIKNMSGSTGIKQKINELIVAALASWTGPKDMIKPNNIRELVDYEVNEYMRGAAKVTTTTSSATSTTTTKSTKRKSGYVTVLTASPATGQIEDSSTISFTTPYPVAPGERYAYSYNETTGIYTVDTMRRGKVIAYPGRHGGGRTISEQFGKIILDQVPDVTQMTSVITDDMKYVMANNIDTQFHRLEDNLACYIKDKKYIEFKMVDISPTVRGISNVRELDLTPYFVVNPDETMTIGKYAVHNGFVFVIVYRHTRLPVERLYDDLKLGEQYAYRKGAAAISGELIIISRTTTDTRHITGSFNAAANQIYQSGFTDVIEDAKTGQLIFAELSSTAHSVNLTYDTAEFFIFGSDMRPVSATDVTKTSKAAFNSWINIQFNADIRGPQAVHVKKSGTKTWELRFPKLTINRYKFDTTTMQLTVDKELFSESGTTLTTKQEKACFGGYTNIMLYQDVHDPDQTMPIYLGRVYDAWLQWPYPSNDYIIVPEVNQTTNTYVLDKGQYVNGAIPGELLGMFGVDYFKLKDDGTTTHIADVPGGHGKARSLMKDDVPGSLGVSGLQTNSYLTLLQLNNYVSTAYIENIRKYSIYHTIYGGPGNSSLAVATQSQYGWYFNILWGAGIHTYNTRFVVIRDATEPTPATDPPNMRLVITGSWEPMRATQGSYPYRGHDPNMQHEDAVCGVFTVPFKVTTNATGGEAYWPVYSGSILWQSYGFTDNVRDNHNNFPPEAYVPPQYTVQSTRSDIQVTDPNTYYTILSAFRRQFDIYVQGIYMYVNGYLWWRSDRQMYKLKSDVLSGWAIDPTTNFRGDESYGVNTPKLQVY